jgi:hypothetical protein
MSSQRRLISALEVFARHRQEGSHSKRHVAPIINFAAAELVHRGIPRTHLREEVPTGCFYTRQIDLIVGSKDQPEVLLFIITQSGSVRKNLNNRRRDIVGDALNLRLAHPEAGVGLIYLLTADTEATRRGTAGTSPVEELTEFLCELQRPHTGLGRPLLDGAALIAAECEPKGRIRIEPVVPEVDILGTFFNRLVQAARNCGFRLGS